MADRLKDRSALVTGGGSGIGAATARVMAREGASVAVVDLDGDRAAATATAIAEGGGRAIPIACDVADTEAVHDAYEVATAAYGIPTAVFNNAGIGGPLKPIPDVTDEEFDHVIGVNLRGVFLVAREFLRRLLDTQTRGAMVCTASIDALYAEPRCAPYCATKGGVVSMARAMALDHAAQGIRINCVCPGYVVSGMTRSLWDGAPGSEQETAAMHALGRVAQPEEIASVVVFLCSEEASFVTGHPMVVDGGMSIGPPHVPGSELYGPVA